MYALIQIFNIYPLNKQVKLKNGKESTFKSFNNKPHVEILPVNDGFFIQINIRDKPAKLIKQKDYPDR